MSEFPFRTCKCCGDLLAIEQFQMANGYRRNTCRMCVNMANKLHQVSERHRQFNALVRWPPARIPSVESHGTG